MSEFALSDPTTVQDCRVDSWSGDGAIMYNLRGPMMLLDNEFTNGPAGGPVVYYFAGMEDGAKMEFSGNSVPNVSANTEPVFHVSDVNVELTDLFVFADQRGTGSSRSASPTRETTPKRV